jgi:hypothetical protein
MDRDDKLYMAAFERQGMTEEAAESALQLAKNAALKTGEPLDCVVGRLLYATGATPPIGIMPEHIWTGRRMGDLSAAIERYMERYKAWSLAPQTRWRRDLNRLYRQYIRARKRFIRELRKERRDACKGHHPKGKAAEEGRA